MVPTPFITVCTVFSLFSSFWHIYNVGCECAFLRTIKVKHGVDGHRVPRHPRNLAVHQTARMSCKAVCTTDGWSVQLTSYFSRLALSACLITIPTWEQGFYVVCVCMWRCAFVSAVRLGCAAGKCEDVCMLFDLDYVWAHDIFYGALEHKAYTYTDMHKAHREHIWDVL